MSMRHSFSQKDGSVRQFSTIFKKYDSGVEPTESAPTLIPVLLE